MKFGGKWIEDEVDFGQFVFLRDAAGGSSPGGAAGHSQEVIHWTAGRVRGGRKRARSYAEESPIEVLTPR